MNAMVQIYDKVLETKQVVEKSFFEEMREGWEWYERNQKEERLKEFKQALDQEVDKESFNAQMLATYVDMFEAE